MNDLEERLSAAFHARAEQVRPEHLVPAPSPATARRRPPVLRVAVAALAAGAVAATVAVSAGRAGSPEQAGEPPIATHGPQTEPVVKLLVQRLPADEPVSYDDAVATLSGATMTLRLAGDRWTFDVTHLDRPALTGVTVDLGRHVGYVLAVGPQGDPSIEVLVPGPGGRLVRATWSMALEGIELPTITPDPGYVGWSVWVGLDGRLHASAYRGSRVAEEVYRWTLPSAIPSGADEVELVPVAEPLEERP